jgi:chemotaxis protein CheX
MMAAGAAITESSGRENWVPVLQLAAQEVFELMLSCKITVLEAPVAFEPDITAMVGLAGQLCGVLSIHCVHTSAGLMASKMLGIEADQVGPETCDAFGEVCNMVAGNFKNKIAGLSDGCTLSVPTVITGQDYHLRSFTDGCTIESRFLFEGLPLAISLQVHN